jgi:hypothetical protein
MVILIQNPTGTGAGADFISVAKVIPEKRVTIMSVNNAIFFIGYVILKIWPPIRLPAASSQPGNFGSTG